MFTSLSADVDLGEINTLRVQVVDVSDAIEDSQLEQIRSGVAKILTALNQHDLKPVASVLVRHDPAVAPDFYNVVVPFALFDQTALRNMPQLLDACGARDVDLASVLPYTETLFTNTHQSIIDQGQGQIGPLYLVFEIDYAKEAEKQQAG